MRSETCVRFGRGCLWFVFLLCVIGMSARACADEPLREITMQTGETRVFSHPGVARVAIGNGQVLNAMTADGHEVIVFARAEGMSSVHVWSNGKKVHAYTVHVLAAGAPRMRAELDALLKRIPSARTSLVGERIVIEGENLSDDDRARVAALSERYSAVLDFTGQVGWDQMVLLDVQVVEIPSSRLREFGVRWNGAMLGGVNAGVAWDGGSVSRLTKRPGETPVEGPMGLTKAAGYFGVNALLSARIAALAHSGEAVMLAQPQLLARSGATASFLAGGEVPYTSTDAKGNPTTIFKPYGVSLQITPRVDRNGVIRSLIEVEASSVDATIDSPAGPALRTRRASTEFNVRSGNTLVIGGFLSREQASEVNGLPLLGDIPILGALFASRRFQRRETELAIFVTPRIVSQDEPEMVNRIQQGQKILEAAFPEAPRLGPANPLGPTWDAIRGKGSQWANSPVRARPPTKRQGLSDVGN